MACLRPLHGLLRLLIPAALGAALAGCGDGGGSTGAPPAASYILSGSVSHLDSGPLTISDGSETLTVAQGASTFAFTKPLGNGATYAVSVTTQPSGLNCVVSNASGMIAGGAVGNVAIACNTVVSQPVSLGVSPSGSLNSNSTRIFLPVAQVGSAVTSINAVLDTGSAGTLLRASDVFPASMVSANGFAFPAGQTSLTYAGITITNVVASRIYGAQSATVTEQTGNLGFAQVTFGKGTSVTTATVPILFVYRTTSNGNPVATSNFANLIGINPDTNPIMVDGVAATSTTTPCTPQSTTTCGIASPFRYLSYADGIDKGFVLNRVDFAPCDITTAASCPVTPALTLGLATSTLSGFGTTALSSCRSVVLMGPGTEPACSQVIPSVTFASGNYTVSGPAIFDSGYPSVRLSVPTGMTFPDSLPTGSAVRIGTTTGFAYQYTTGTGYLYTTVTQGANSNGFTNTGIAFFAQNSLLVDYAKSLEGWHNF